MCMLCRSFCTFLLAIVLSVLLRVTDYDYPFGIFKLFLCNFCYTLWTLWNVNMLLEVRWNCSRLLLGRQYRSWMNNFYESYNCHQCTITGVTVMVYIISQYPNKIYSDKHSNKKNGRQCKSRAWLETYNRKSLVKVASVMHTLYS